MKKIDPKRYNLSPRLNLQQNELNEIVDEISREKNMDYAMDNMIDDEDSDNG